VDRQNPQVVAERLEPYRRRARDLFILANGRLDRVVKRVGRRSRAWSFPGFHVGF
jgi:hypothetical protein